MKRLGKAEDALGTFEKWLCTAALGVMFLATIVQVIIRTVHGGSLGTDEISMVAASVLIFIGAGAAVYTHDHITIDLVELIKNSRTKKIVNVISDLALGLFGVVFTYYSFLYLLILINSGESTIQLGIPMSLPVSCMFVGGILIVIHSLFRLIRTSKGLDRVPDSVELPDSEIIGAER